MYADQVEGCIQLCNRNCDIKEVSREENKIVIKGNSHESTDGVVAGLTARVVRKFTLVDVFAIVTVCGQHIPDLARAFFLAGWSCDAKLLTPRVS